MKKTIALGLSAVLLASTSFAFADAMTWAKGGNSSFGVANYINQPSPISVSVTTYSGQNGSGNKLESYVFKFPANSANQQQTHTFSTNAQSFYSCVQYSSSGQCYAIIHGSSNNAGITNTSTINNAGIKVYSDSTNKH